MLALCQTPDIAHPRSPAVLACYASVLAFIRLASSSVAHRMKPFHNLLVCVAAGAAMHRDVMTGDDKLRGEGPAAAACARRSAHDNSRTPDTVRIIGGFRHAQGACDGAEARGVDISHEAAEGGQGGPGDTSCGHGRAVSSRSFFQCAV